MDASVVIPTHNRPELLRRCVAQVLDQQGAGRIEVVVANDGTVPVPDEIRRDTRVVVLDGPFGGPAAARNAGVRHASSEIVAFTDDDAVPRAGWLRAAVGRLDADPAAVGVVGRVDCPSYDPLFETAVESDGIGNFLTCNAAYRRWALVEVGGFDEAFVEPHCEDRDLGYRLARLGAIVYEPLMRVTHPSRPVTVGEMVRRGRLVTSDWRLHRKHPETRPPRWSVRWGPVVQFARRWQRMATEQRVIARQPRRAARFAAMAGGQVAVAAWTAMREWRLEAQRPLPEVSGENRRLRVAYVGPEPKPGGDVAGCAALVIEGLSRLGCEVDCYVCGITGDASAAPAGLRGVRVVRVDTGWRSNRWYSNTNLAKFVTGNASQAFSRRRVGALLEETHAVEPYDVVYQFSSIELFGLRRRLDGLPPLVLHPSVHAAGELRWQRAEQHLVEAFEPRARRFVVKAALTYRSWRQRHDAPRAEEVIAIGRAFARDLVADCGVESERLTVVPYPIDLEAFLPVRSTERGTPLRILFVGRMSVRKGVEHVVGLSHRLADLAGQVRIDCVGHASLWSDYRPLLVDLHPVTARYHGYLGHDELRQFVAGADLLVQPAKYEPFGLTVGEALASGLPVVATTEVGAAEDVDPGCCALVPPDDLDALEKAVRAMLDRVAADGPAMRALARREAERLFSPDLVAHRVLEVLQRAARQGPGPAERSAALREYGS